MASARLTSSQFDLSAIKRDRAIYEKALIEVINLEVQSARNRATVFTVKFEVVCKAPYGQGVKLVGNHWKLGNWNARNAMVMNWTQGDVWVAEVVFDDVPNKWVEFKYILTDRHRRAKWEEGYNHVIQLTQGGELHRGKVYHVLRNDWTPR